MPKPLIVQFTPIKSCLVNLPPKWVNALLDQNKLPQNVILEIASSSPLNSNQQNKKLYCGWSGEASKPLNPNSVFTHGPNSKLDVLEMDPQVGLSSGFTDGQKILVEFCRNVPECATVSVEPLTEDDWEILELHAGYVEENLLSKLRVVYPGQIVCVWIYGKTLVKLVVASEGIDPKVEYAKLTNMSEVIVAPKVRNKTKSVEESNDLATSGVNKKKQRSIGLRVCPLKISNELTVHVHPDSIHALGEQAESKIIKLSKLVPAYNYTKKVEKEENGNNNEEVLIDGEAEEQQQQIAKSIFATFVLSKDIPLRHIAIGSVLARTLDIKDFDIVKVSATNVKKNPAGGSLILKRFVSSNNTTANATMKLGLESAQQQAQQKVQFENETTKALQEWLTGYQQKKQELVLSQGTVLELTVEDKKEHFLLLLGAKKGLFSSGNNNTDPEQYIVLSPGDKLPSTEFSDPIQRCFTFSAKAPAPLEPMGGVDKVLSKITNYTLANLSERDLKSSLGVPGSGGVLVSGSHGSGKTSLVHTILDRLHKDNIYTLEINCSELADERIPVFRDNLQKWFDQAAWHAPSLVFLDDLDRLIPAEVEHADSTRSRHLAELFVKMAQQACSRHNIMLVATTQQQQSLHPALITHHIFSELNHLQPPNRDERKLIMQAIMSHGPSVLTRTLPLIDLVSVASETEGFLAADLKSFIERTVHEGAVRSIKKKMDLIRNVTEQVEISEEAEKEDLTLVQADFTKAREGFVPSSLRGVKLQSSGVAWSDIGGLNETRKALLETLEWPTKYAAVFAQCPLRLRSGLLLYGYPGCGKTLLASAVAKECGLNFISVKGPEILNKYIGASEKSVRDLFERAQAAKPCVLFFDEFDSIAPRRGHDSTGVTDRVVNQMLTQMDGAEGLDGVYVLAATSRPDLIDPALLRPGRLDKALLCGLPNLQERIEILQALSGSKMKLANDVNLIEYAEKTEGFSGADLQGFLYNAHLEAIHGAIDMDSFKQAQNRKSSSGKNEKSDFVMSSGGNNKKKNVPLTLAEKSQISSRLAMIKKGVNKDGNTAKDVAAVKESVAATNNNEALITKAYLDKSLKSTRPSITVEESYRLGMIYNEFVTGRTGELPSGEGDKGVGKRSTLG